MTGTNNAETTTTRVRLQSIALLVVAFVAGGVTGAALARSSEHRTGEAMFVRASEPNAQSARGPALGDFVGREGRIPASYARLGLSADQTTRIQGIIQRAQPQADSIMRETMPRLRALTDSINTQVQAVLTPEQRQQFIEWRAQRRREEPLERRDSQRK